MRSLKYTLLFSVLSLAIVTTASCSLRSELNGQGYVMLTLNDPEIEILTKGENEIVNNDYNVVITKGDTEKINDIYGNLKTKFLLEAGDYKVYAHNIDAGEALSSRDGRGAQRFYGEHLFTIQPGRVNEVSFTCEMVNARVSVGLDDTFKQVFKTSEITIYEASDDSRQLVYPHTTTIENEELWGYFNIDDNPEIIVNVAVTRNDGRLNNFTSKVTLEAKTWHKIVLKSSTTDGEASLDIYVNDTLVEVEETWGVDPY